jgi:hypothetical protein
MDCRPTLSKRRNELLPLPLQVLIKRSGNKQEYTIEQPSTLHQKAPVNKPGADKEPSPECGSYAKRRCIAIAKNGVSDAPGALCGANNYPLFVPNQQPHVGD